MKRSGASRATVRSPMSLPRGGEHRARARGGPRAAGGRRAGGRARPRRRGRRPRACRSSRSRGGPRRCAHRAALAADRLVRVGAAEGRHLVGLGALGGEPERVLEAEARAEHRALGLEAVVDRGRALRPRRRQLLVGESDREAAAVVLADLGVGVGAGREVAEAGDVHREDVHAGVALDDPVGEREADAAALGKARHHAAGAVEVAQARDRADQRVAVGREGERAVDHALDAGALERREMRERDLERGRDAVEVGRQQLVAEVRRAWSSATRARRRARRCRAAAPCPPGACRSRPRSRSRAAAPRCGRRSRAAPR